jgi:hypothetical protein
VNWIRARSTRKPGLYCRIQYFFYGEMLVTARSTLVFAPAAPTSQQAKQSNETCRRCLQLGLVRSQKRRLLFLVVPLVVTLVFEGVGSDCFCRDELQDDRYSSKIRVRFWRSLSTRTNHVGTSTWNRTALCGHQGRSLVMLFSSLSLPLCPPFHVLWSRVTHLLQTLVLLGRTHGLSLPS